MKIALIIPALAIFSAIALLIGAAATVNAGHHGSMFGAELRDMVSNNDGMLSFEEYSTYHFELKFSADIHSAGV
jgi:hypothetical protein